MAVWKEIILSGSAAELSSVQLRDSSGNTQVLGVTSGGTGIPASTLASGDIVVGNASNQLSRFSVGTGEQVLKVNTTTGVNKLKWETDISGGVDEVLSANALLSVANSTTTPTLTLITGTVAQGSRLVKGSEIVSYFNGAFTQNPGTITGVTATESSLQNSLTFTAADIGTQTSTDKKRELILGGTITDLDKTNLNSNNRGFTLGSTLFQLGQTKTDIDGISGLQFSNPSNKNPFVNVGANDLTIGVGNGTVRIPGNLEVEGTASFTNADNVRIKDKVFTVGDGSDDVTGGIFIQQSNPSGFLVGNAFILKQDSTYGTYDGRWGFLRNTNVAQIENGTEVPTGAETKPWSAIVTVTTDGTSPVAAPKFGGSSKGHGNLHVDTSGNGKAYVYL